jgi:hypothetical protein
MKISWINVSGLSIIVSVLLVILLFVSHYPFPLVEYANLSLVLVTIETTEIGSEISRFLWTYRLIDVMAQAFVLFAAAVCGVAILRDQGEKK